MCSAVADNQLVSHEKESKFNEFIRCDALGGSSFFTHSYVVYSEIESAFNMDRCGCGFLSPLVKKILLRFGKLPDE